MYEVGFGFFAVDWLGFGGLFGKIFLNFLLEVGGAVLGCFWYDRFE